MATIDMRGATLSAADPPIGTNPNPDLAIKAPVRLATTGANINLQTFGLGTIDGVALAAGDRVLVKDQADQTTNGIYNASSGPWTRSIDAANNSQWTQGTLVEVATGQQNSGLLFQLTAGNPVILGTSNLTFAQQSLYGPISITVPTGLGQGISITQNVLGTNASGSEQYSNLITIASDNAAFGLGLNYFGVNASFGGSLLTGTRSGALFYLTQTAPTGNRTNGLGYYVGVTPIVQVDGSGDGGTNTGAGALGGYYGSNPQVRSTATNVLYLIGSEQSVFGSASATQAYQIGHISAGYFVNNGTLFDAAYALNMSSSAPYGQVTTPGNGWKFGYCVAELGPGFNPLHSTLGVAFGGFVTALSTIPCKYVLDMRAFTPTTDQIIGKGITIDPAGQPTFGAGTGNVVATINGGGSGGSSGALVNLQNGGSGIAAFGGKSAYFGGAYDPTTILSGFYGLQLYTNNVQAAAIDASQNVTLANAVTAPGYKVGANQVVGARITGYAAMTGTPDKASTFATSTVTLAQLAGRVMQMQADFTTHGLIGA